MQNALNLLKAKFILAAMLMLGILSSSASAADTWLPGNFSSNQHVYLDPALSSSRFPVALPGLEQKLKDAGTAQNLSFYFICTQQGDEANGSISGQKFGAWKLDQFAAQVQNKLPADDYVLILLVRSGDDPSKVSLAAQGGNRLQSYNMGPAWMNSNSGPLVTNRATYLPNDPAGFAVAVASDINQTSGQFIAQAKQRELDAKAAAEKAQQDAQAAAAQAQQEAAFRAALPGRITAVSVPLSLLLSAGISLLLVSRARRKLQASIDTYTKLFDNSNTNYLELRNAYFGFLQNQGTDWSKKFTGATLATYTAAVTKYADLSARVQATQALLEQARRAAKTSLFAPLKGVQVSGTVVAGAVLAGLVFVATSWVWALALAGVSLVIAIALATRSLLASLQQGYAVLELNSVKVSGKALPIEERSFFDSVVEETTYKTPADLLQDMAALFNASNKALASIKNGFDGARKNRDEIEVLSKQVEDGKQRLGAAGLNFAPYEADFGAIKTATNAFLAILASDPMSAFEQSETVENDVKALNAKIERAIKSKGELAGVEQLIAKAGAHAAEVRAQDADYSYPEKDAKAPADAPKKTLLNEPGGNPDGTLKSAAEHLTAAHTAILAGELDLSDKEKQAALQDASNAGSMVDNVLAARSYLQRQVLPVRANVQQLSGEVPAATQNVAALKSDFLAKNYEGQPAKLDNANSVIGKTEGVLAQVRQAFFEQRYLAARQLLSGIGSAIQQSRNQLQEVANCLSTLRGQRDYARQTVSQARQLSNALRDKLRSQSFTTSAATDDSFSRLQTSVSAQEKDVTKAVTDWPAAADAADKLVSNCNKIDSTIDEERKAYDNAGRRIEELRSAVGSAANVVSNPDTRDAAARKLEEARSALASLDSAYRVAKSDWNALAGRVDASKAIAAEAARLAEADHALAQQARNEIDAVDSRIRSLALRSFTQTVSGYGHSRVISLNTAVDLSEASQRLSNAASYLRRSDYETARSEAARANASCDSAEAWANAQLAAEAAEIMREWEEEERRRQEAERQRQEEERRRQEEEQRRQDEERRRKEDEDRRNNGGNGGGGGGGGNGGGGSGDGGGRSGGGVDGGGSGRSGSGVGDF
jgi:uncharacterized membrane protein YgcG